jgi:hypothetical protein
MNLPDSHTFLLAYKKKPEIKPKVSYKQFNSEVYLNCYINREVLNPVASQSSIISMYIKMYSMIDIEVIV